MTVAAYHQGYVLDASVAAKWFIRHGEGDRELAMSIRQRHLSGHCRLIMPEFALLEVANAIRALKDYKGITGTYNFDKNGDPNPAQYFIFQVVSTDPADWNQNTLVTSYDVDPPK